MARLAAIDGQLSAGWQMWWVLLYVVKVVNSNVPRGSRVSQLSREGERERAEKHHLSITSIRQRLPNWQNREFQWKLSVSHGLDNLILHGVTCQPPYQFRSFEPLVQTVFTARPRSGASV
jgi:hypothetical protein